MLEHLVKNLKSASNDIEVHGSYNGENFSIVAKNNSFKQSEALLKTVIATWGFCHVDIYINNLEVQGW